MEKNLDYKKVCSTLFTNWHYLVATILLFLAAGYIFMQLVIPKYRSQASMKIDDKKSELAELMTIRNFYDRTAKSETEKFILGSRKVLTKAVESLPYQTSYFISGTYHLTNIYPLQPLHITKIQLPADETINTRFEFKYLDSRFFQLNYELEGDNHQQRFAFGQPVHIAGFSFVVAAAPALNRFRTTAFSFRFNQLQEVLKLASENLQIDDNLNTNVLTLSYTHENPVYARDVLNSVISEYRNYDKSLRSVSIKQTSIYIDTLLQNMAALMQQSGLDMQHFKADHGLLNISSNSEVLITKLTSYETERHEVRLRLLVTAQLKKDLGNTAGLNVPNVNLQSVQDPQLTTLLTKHNELVDKKLEALPVYRPTSAYVHKFDEQIADIRKAIISNIDNQQEKDKELLSFLNQQIRVAKDQIKTAPKLERDFISIQSNLAINQKVHNYLSEKRLEAQIATAAITSNAQVIDEATLANKPIYPLPTSVYKDFLLAGVLLGVTGIVVARRFNPYIYDAEEIESRTLVPIVGCINKHPGKTTKQILSLEMPRSLFAESVRAMRANLHTLASRTEGKVICVTSSVAGEGKSFTSVNLAGTLCALNRSVIIVASDLRKSSLHQVFELDNRLGLSSYLSDQASNEEIYQTTNFTNLTVVTAGPSPENPAELLQSDRMAEFIQVLRKRFDYVILDSAPVGLVSDTIPLMRIADINLFVLRAGISRLDAITLPEKLLKEFRLSHIAIVLNAFKQGNNPRNTYSLTPTKASYYHELS